MFLATNKNIYSKLVTVIIPTYNHEKYIESWLSLLTDDDYMEAVKDCVKVFSFLLNVNAKNQYKEVA